MKSSYLVNLLLLLLVSVLFWFNTQQDADDVTAKTISNLGMADITTLSIEKEGQLTAKFVKEGEDWLMLTPVKAEANQTRIDVLLSLLALPVSSTLAITDHTDLNQFGLNKYSPVLMLNNLQFQFGSVVPISERRYVRHQQTLYLLPDTIAPLLNVNSYSFIDNQLLSSDQKISSLQIPILGEQGQFKLRQLELIKQDGHWQSNSDHSVDQLQTLIDHWQYAQALQVLPASRLDFTKDKAHTLKLGINDDTVTKDYLLYSQDRALFIIDSKQQLAYQFIADLKQQLFLKVP